MDLLDQEDITLIMQREVHFDGSFEEMLDYFQDLKLLEIREDISIDRIEALMDMENDGVNLLSLLDDSDIETIEEYKVLYEKIRNKANDMSNPEEAAVATFILDSEILDEDAIEHIATYGNKIVSYLIDIIDSEEMYSYLAPGQGHAPAFAAKALKKIGNSNAIISVFTKILNVDQFTEGAFLSYLKSFPPKIEKVIENILKRDFWSKDHDIALAIAIGLDFNKKISDMCFEILQDEKKCPSNVTSQIYLATLAEGDLDNPQNRHEEIKKIKHLHSKTKEFNTLI